MSEKRPYRSQLRQEQAADTRQRIVQAAYGLFVSQGYPGTTIEAIARQAQVAVETVYAAFGNKKALLTRLVQIALLGDEGTTPLFERPGPQAVRREIDPRRQVALFAADMRSIMERVGPLLEVIRAAAQTNDDLAGLLRNLLDQRLEGMRRFVGFLRSRGPLRRGLSQEAAAETVWALTSPDLHRLLTVDRGWTGERYEAWLSDALQQLLLP
jgi:AcrR family transcriptional regulator